MRIPEKTIELNFCAQLLPLLPPGAFWFGLTQAQEKRAGFDACSRVAGSIVVFQFKASNQRLRNGDRRFQLDHHQLGNLQRVASHSARSVYYVFPLFGTTLELPKPPFLLPVCGLLDVRQLPAMGPPTRRDGKPRQSRIHYADVRTWSATIHSDPVDAKVVPATEAARVLAETRGIGFLEIDGREGESPLQTRFTGGAYAVFLPHHSRGGA